MITNSAMTRREWNRDRFKKSIDRNYKGTIDIFAVLSLLTGGISTAGGGFLLLLSEESSVLFLAVGFVLIYMGVELLSIDRRGR